MKHVFKRVLKHENIWTPSPRHQIVNAINNKEMLQSNWFWYREILKGSSRWLMFWMTDTNGQYILESEYEREEKKETKDVAEGTMDVAEETESEGDDPHELVKHRQLLDVACERTNVLE